MKIQNSLVSLCLMALGSVSFAQDQPVSKITGQPASGASRLELGLSFAEAVGTSSFSVTQTVRENAEDGTVNSSYKVGSAPGFGVHVQYNLTEKFGVRLGAQTFSRKSEGTFTGQSPHPFFFNRPRTFSGSQSGLSFSEAAFSLTGVLRGESGKWNFALEGGPAYFSVNATLADRAQYTDTYPHDAVTFSGISSSKKKVSPIGFAVGVEFGRQLANSVSVVAQGRYTGGTGSVDLNGSKADIKAGGAQARIGLRIVVARKRVGA